MLKRVATIVCDAMELNPEDIKPEHNLVTELGLSSLDVVAVISKFEEEFDVEIPDRDIMKFMTIGDIVEYLQFKISAQ